MPTNPLSHAVFNDDKWKAVLKARDTISERATGKKGGTLNEKDLVQMEQQVKIFAREIEAHGWEIQGPEA